MKAVIAGAGTYGEVYLSYISKTEDFHVIGFVDDSKEKQGTTVRGLPVLGTTSVEGLLMLKARGIEAIFAPIGNNRVRVDILDRAKALGLQTPSYIHPSACISRDTAIGNGVYILPNSVLMPYAVLRDYVMISMGANIAHHSTLHSGVFISTGANVGAGIELGACAFVGIGATIMTGVSNIGADAIVGAGAVVIRDVPDFITVAGVPAKPIKGA